MPGEAEASPCGRSGRGGRLLGSPGSCWERLLRPRKQLQQLLDGLLPSAARNTAVFSTCLVQRLALFACLPCSRGSRVGFVQRAVLSAQQLFK